MYACSMHVCRHPPGHETACREGRLHSECCLVGVALQISVPLPQRLSRTHIVRTYRLQSVQMQFRINALSPLAFSGTDRSKHSEYLTHASTPAALGHPRTISNPESLAVATFHPNSCPPPSPPPPQTKEEPLFEASGFSG